MAYIYKPKRKNSNISNLNKRQEVYNTTLWKKMRLAYLTEHPLCEICVMEGKTTLGEDIHHVHSFMDAKDIYERDRLAFDSNNLITVCKICHSRLHNGDLKGCRTKNEIELLLQKLHKSL